MDDDLKFSNKFITDPAISNGYGMTEEIRTFKLKQELLKPEYDSGAKKTSLISDEEQQHKDFEKNKFVKEKRTVLSVDSNQRLFFDTNDINDGDEAAFENYFSGEQYEDFRRLWSLLVGVQQDVVSYEQYRQTNDIAINVITREHAEAESNIARGSSTELCRKLIDGLVKTRGHIDGHDEINRNVNANLLDLMVKIADDDSYSGVLAIVNELNAYAMAAATVNPEYFWRPFYYDVADKRAKIIIYKEQNPNSYTITLPRIINHVKSIRLLSTEIPNTINNITERNNIITLNLRYKQPTNTSDTTTTTDGEYPYRPVELNPEKTLFNFILVKLDIGAYTIEELIQHLEDKLNKTIIEQTTRRFGKVFWIKWVKATGAILIECLRQELEFHLKFYSRITELQKVYNNLGELEGYTHGIITEFSHDLWYMLGFPWPYMIDVDTKDKYVQSLTNVVSFGAHPEFAKVHTNNDIFDRTTNQVGSFIDNEYQPYTGPQYSELTLQQNLLNDQRYESIQFMRPYRYPSITFKYIYLVLKGYKSMDHMNQHNVVVEFTERDFFAKVLLDSAKGAIAYNTFVSNPLIFTNAIDKITSLDVMWVDERGRVVDFGKVDHSFTLEFIHYVTQNDTTGYDSRLGLIDKASYPEYLSGTEAKK